MRTRFSCLLASASLALWPTLGSAMPVHGSESGDLSLAGTSLGQKFLRIVVGYSFSVSGANFSSITLPVSLNGAVPGPCICASAAMIWGLASETATRSDPVSRPFILSETTRRLGLTLMTRMPFLSATC